jgi:serine/threonine-protein kinase
MTVKEDRRGIPSIEVSPHETRVDPQLAASASDKSPHDAPAQSITVRLVAGQLIGGRYRIERELGEGGMGIVYLAADEQVPGERFAIKVLKEELHGEILTSLREEVRKTRKLSHPNIVDVHSVNLDGRMLYVLMEYLEGKCLDALLDEDFGRGMSFSRAWPIIEDVGAALGNAHDHNIIHSDLKPANVFVTSAGRSKLLDFGIARASRGPLLRVTEGPRALTPAYASPEMLEGQEADRRDDLYSFACVIYEMLCGERPFGHLNALDARDAGIKVAPLQGLSREQNAALSQALAFARGARTGTVESLLAAISPHARRRARPGAVGAAILITTAVVGLAYFALDWVSRHAVAVGGAAEKSRPALAAATAGSAAEHQTPPRSIAVLPFVNISGDPQQEYFSDGLSEELIDHLVQTTDMTVIARTSSFQFKGKNEDVRSIGRSLAVTHLLEGSVRKEGQRLRIAAQLIRASDGAYLWSETYDRNLADIFKVQDDIAVEVSQALHVALGEGSRPATRQPDLAAYNLVLEGKYLESRRTVLNVERAAGLYAKAIALDSDYALAWARLAHAYLTQEILKGLPSEDQNRRVLDALDHAFQHDPKLVFAYYTRGAFEANVTWNWAAAAADTERIRELEPRSDLLPGASGDIAFVFGQLDRAIDSYRNGLVRNPLDPNTMDSLGIALCAADRLTECLQARLKLMDLHPDFDGINSSVALARLHLGQLSEALAAMQQEPNEDYRLRGLVLVYWKMGRHPESQAALNSLTRKYATSDPYGIATAHAYRGDIDAAFQWLERAYREHDHAMTYLKTDPLLTNARGDSRLVELINRMNLTEHAQPVSRVGI